MKTDKIIKSRGLIGSALIGEIRGLIEQAREQVAVSVNRGMVMLYWEIGTRIRKEILRERRAEYGKEILQTLSAKLVADYGRGYSPRNLSYMITFGEVFPEPEIVQTLSAQLSWSHFVEILSLEDELQRDFYAEMCRLERWSVRALRDKIAGMLFERTAISKKPEKLIKHELQLLRAEDQMTPDLVFRDPYLLHFLGLINAYSERDLESAIIREMEQFILELGEGFSFVARQKRITVDSHDYYLDLLFYHRKLHRLLALDLKLGKFQAADKGQMELYLRWLDKYERAPGESSPLGLILCAGKSDEHIELLQLDKSQIRVAQYLTELPSREVMARKLRSAIRRARERMALGRPPIGGKKSPAQKLPP